MQMGFKNHMNYVPSFCHKKQTLFQKKDDSFEYNIPKTNSLGKAFNSSNLAVQESMKYGLKESASAGLLNNNCNCSNELGNSFEHSSRSTAPSCWSLKHQGYFTSTYPWITFSNGKLGCRVCKNVNTLELHAYQRSRIIKDWVECTVFPCK